MLAISTEAGRHYDACTLDHVDKKPVCLHDHLQLQLQIKGEFEIDDPPLFYGCFKHLASKGDAELRRNCAAQFGQVLKAASMAQPGAFSLHFVETLHSMTADGDEEVSGCC